jgi:membrane protein implicated in regulation of membrane protease activity
VNELTLIPVFWHWWALAALLLLIELLAPGLYFLWLALAALLTGLLLLVITSLGIYTQVAMFSLFAVAGILLARGWLKKHATVSDQPSLNQRTAGYVGRIVRLDQPITAGRGNLHLDGSIWNITGADLPASTLVRIVGVDGLTLKVEAVKS